MRSMRQVLVEAEPQAAARAGVDLKLFRRLSPVARALLLLEALENTQAEEDEATAGGGPP